MHTHKTVSINIHISNKKLKLKGVRYLIQIGNLEEVFSTVSQNTSPYCKDLFNKAFSPSNYWRRSEMGTPPRNFSGLARKEKKKKKKKNRGKNSWLGLQSGFQG